MNKQLTYDGLLERIEYFRKKNNWDYITISRESGVPLTTLMHIMKGTSKNPGIFTIQKLCNGFKITLEEFFQVNDTIEKSELHHYYASGMAFIEGRWKSCGWTIDAPSFIEAARIANSDDNFRIHSLSDNVMY